MNRPLLFVFCGGEAQDPPSAGKLADGIYLLTLDTRLTGTTATPVSFNSPQAATFLRARRIEP